jgi:hypothetical protein
MAQKYENVYLQRSIGMEKMQLMRDKGAMPGGKYHICDCLTLLIVDDGLTCLILPKN